MDQPRPLIVVTGLPRSGTSMMMQMLAAGGIEPYTDHKRPPDAHNPRGYFEHENVKRLARDASWIAEARGKAVKIVAPLLPFLPSGEEYRVIFMRRDLDAVLTSQQAMLAALGAAGDPVSGAALIETFAAQIDRLENWLPKLPRAQTIAVDYAAARTDPAGTAAKLTAFLGPPFDAHAAAAAVF